MSAMYSKNGIIINKNGTTGVATIKSEDGTVKVDTTTLPNGVQYNLSVNTDIIATKKSVEDLESSLVDKQDKLTPGSNIAIINNIISATGIPTKTSELVNDSGFISDVSNWNEIALTNTELNTGDSYLSINSSLRLFKCQITYRTVKSLNKGGWYTMCTFEPITTDISAIQCSMDLGNDHNRYILGRVNLSEGKLELYAFDGSINSGVYVNVVGCPIIFSNY